MPETLKIPRSALPSNDDERSDWLQLIRSRRVGPVTFVRLVREHGSARGALAALPEVAGAAGVQGYEVFSRAAVDIERTAAAEIGARMLCLGSESYPPLLAMISDPPPILWALGDISLAIRPAIGMVGARNASSLGRRMTRLLAKGITEAGVVVISGLARGIDAEAHEAAIDGGTIAIQAGGVDTVYPRENAQLAEKIAKHGLRLSEMPMGMSPQARHFPRRNRIISGMATALVVVEGASRSGSLITAKDALDQGREVMAVPGNPLDGRAAGCNMLIRDGATLVRSSADILAVFPEPASAPTDHAKPDAQFDSVAPAGDLSSQILSLLNPNPISEDMLIRQTGWPAKDVLGALVNLELDRQIERGQGGTVSIAL